MRKTLPEHSDDVELAKGITVSIYHDWERQMDREKIADFIYQRFEERYLNPVRYSHVKHGFTMMAIACLMIEALESFEQGWGSTRGKSGPAFKRFFKQHAAFNAFDSDELDFYGDVRCAILHQAETSGGWIISRNNEVHTDPSLKVINANEFIARLGNCLADYRDRLKQAEWEDDVWRKFRNKMQAVVENCQRDATTSQTQEFKKMKFPQE